MPDAPLELTLVGCGQIARAYLQALDGVSTLRLCAAVDPDATAAAALAEAAAVPAFASIDAMWNAGVRPQAALVLAPPDRHESLSIDLLQRGLDVLCEKPLAPTIAAAERMLATATATGRRLMMGSKFRYTADILTAHDLLAAGYCGDVVMYENVFCSHVDMTARWNAIASHSGGGVLIDNGCHSVDVARFLLGPIARVQAQFGRVAQDVAVEDTARLLFTSESGALGSIDLSWSMHKETAAYVRVHGTAGTLEIGWRQSRRKRVSDAGWTEFGTGYDKVAAFRAQLQNFAAAVLGLEVPLIGDEDALASVVVIDSAYRSQREERWVAVEAR
ncbi:MAG: Gfo/Idh/MocA family oxidoreductase [Planctomycetes bacterium]|nr:Gfo/Idh/MocA family oxidoreductase [Planctomycetota bacterium]